ncbi:threonine dehydratase [Meinhardsimonia xiamenensis]|jgi:threonine dehydratase|uniref:Threonine dehydratase n=1 Tax=Meinhardsimonia xiamenensis TaxID=990712 RepID=A0A1G8Y9A7_9RHOB|nr:threonine dehydratase [Meinhardsimonia xiamenensis]PRX37191.1 threonine dehydratase [Meinhardsimonia xiamenensis]SDJ98630.1 threonine dehydratase [Meinhardsimonia xiamenensis]
MALFTTAELEAAARLVHAQVPPTPTHRWPLLAEATGAEVWVKHENHCPTGAFKVRGGVTFIDWLKRSQPGIAGICTATRGNHGQSQALAATAAELRAKIYVPRGNSVEKNAAMRAYGAELIEFGDDFDTAREEAFRVAEAEGLAIVPPFHRELVRGVATYAFEMFLEHRDLDAVYVPIGCGSGICGTIAARDALGLSTEIIGVVAEGAPCVKLSVEAGRLVESNAARTFADGVAVRVPVQEAFDVYSRGASRIVAVGDDEIAAAIRLMFRATHNMAEGAGAAALAALMAERARMAGRKVAVILSGGNIDTPWAVEVLSGGTPVPA